MGHGCHDCGSPNGCECIAESKRPGVILPCSARYKELGGVRCTLSSGHGSQHRAHDQDGTLYMWPVLDEVVVPACAPLSNPCAHSDRRWDKRMLALAGHVAEWSKDPSTRVGAVLADDYHRVLAVGYNGFPRGVRDDGERYQDRAVKYKLVVHAEANAVLNALGTAEGSTLYATMYPCSECAKLIAQSGVARVVTWRPGTNASDASSHWSDDRAFSDTILRESGVEVVTYLTGEL